VGLHGLIQMAQVFGHRAKTAEFPNFHATSPFIDAIKNQVSIRGRFLA
jgi:hypothetical protein